nr:hypothetical protein [Gemmatimonadales bacterium]
SIGAVRMFERLEALLAPANANGAGRLPLRAGYCAVPNFAESRVDAVEMLLQATSALRQLQAADGAERIRAFAPAPAPAAG